MGLERFIGVYSHLIDVESLIQILNREYSYQEFYNKRY